MRSKALWLLLALVAVLALTASASGTVRTLITGKDIKPHSITSLHMVDHTLQAHDLSPALIKYLQGKTGAVGAQGAKGETGATGATGATGPQGTKGDTGATGAQGPKGDTGATGSTGAAGAKGDPGAGLQLKGVVADQDALKAIPNAAAGDGYLVNDSNPSHLYVYDGTNWIDAGQLTAGPPGQKGDTGATGATGEQGQKGDRGDKGDTGAQGPAGVSGYQLVNGAPVTAPGYDVDNDYPGFISATASCPTGKVVLGGGASFADDAAVVLIGASYPVDSGHGWTIVVVNLMDDTQTATPYAICAAVGS